MDAVQTVEPTGRGRRPRVNRLEHKTPLRKKRGFCFTAVLIDLSKDFKKTIDSFAGPRYNGFSSRDEHQQRRRSRRAGDKARDSLESSRTIEGERSAGPRIRPIPKSETDRLANGDRTHTREKKQKWSWVPETSGKWWTEALASRALREEDAEPR